MGLGVMWNIGKGPAQLCNRKYGLHINTMYIIRVFYFRASYRYHLSLNTYARYL